MIATWNDIPKSRWDRLHAEAGGALQQDWAWGQALARTGAEVARAEVKTGKETVALAQVISRRMGPLGWALCARGPVWLGHPDAPARAKILRVLKRTLPGPSLRAVLITPDDADPFPFRLAGLTRIMTGETIASLDLSPDLPALRAGLDGKWRNRLAAAERAGLEAARAGVKAGRLDWLFDREAAQAEARRYARQSPRALFDAFQDAHGKKEAALALRIGAPEAPVAGMAFLRTGSSAVYHVGWTSEDGRRQGAHNLLLWRAIETLKAEGVRRLDLGGVDTGRGAGLARFKLGAGATPITLSGAWA